MKMLSATVERALRRDWVWYLAIPVSLLLMYVIWFQQFALGQSLGSLRIPAIEKVFFDHTFYLSMVAKDVFHGGSTLPSLLRPWFKIIGWTWPAVSLAEWYVAGVGLSAILSLWTSAIAIEKMGSIDRAIARLASLVAFFLAQVILALRPGAPSWYTPCFFLAILLVWRGESLWERNAHLRALFFWALACALASVYPWYFTLVASVTAALLLQRILSPRRVAVGGGIGLGIVLIGVATCDKWAPLVASSRLAVLAVRNGFAWSYMPVLANTLIVMLLWWVVWLKVVMDGTCKEDRGGDGQQSAKKIMLFAWSAQVILWLQSTVTSFSIVPDHYVYSVWLLSALSFGLLVGGIRPDISRSRLWIMRGIKLCAWTYPLSVVIRMYIGPYHVADFGSLIIHVAIWVFFACTITTWSQTNRLRVMSALATIVVLLGGVSVRSTALAWAEKNSQPDDIRAWFASTHRPSNERWCTDVSSGEYLYANTNGVFSPAILEKQESVSLEALQSRLVEVSRFFHVRAAGQLSTWDDMILNDEDFACRSFGPARAIVHRIPMSEETRVFFIGCDESRADNERRRVIGVMDDAWTAPIPSSSSFCDGFVVRRDLKSYWRIPASYKEIYSGPDGEVYVRL